MTTIAILTEQEQKQIESLKSMIKSCFTYGGIKKNDYNYTRYILPYSKKMNINLFNLIYNQHKTYLELNFKIDFCTYTDSEGLTYNELKQ